MAGSAALLLLIRNLRPVTPTVAVGPLDSPTSAWLTGTRRTPAAAAARQNQLTVIVIR